VLRWARENGCPWNEALVRFVAVVEQQKELIKWINENPWGCTR